MNKCPDQTPAPPRFSWGWLRSRLFPRGTDMIRWASYVIILSVLVFHVIDPAMPREERAFSITILALALLLALNMVWDDLRELFPSEAAGSLLLLLVSGALSLAATWYGQLYSTIYLVFMIAAQANAMLAPWSALLITGAVTVGWMWLLVLMGISSEGLSSVGVGLLIGLTFTVTLSQVLRRYIEQTQRANALLVQLQAANAELVAARQREKELAVAEERVRVARDLHDGLGHHLTALSIQLQAVEKLSKTNPALAAEAASSARGEVQAALREVRQSVGMLRQAPLDLSSLSGAIAALAAECAQRCNLRVTFEEDGPPVDIDPAAAITLYRTAQEGLTNVQKHGQQVQTVRVRLARQAHEVLLSVQDDGRNAPDAPPSGLAEGSYGLAGLRERAALLGGSLTCGARPEGGFEVTICLPLQAAEAAAVDAGANHD